MGIRATQNPLECTPAVLSRFLGEFASLVALQTAHPLPASGSYAVVNETGSDLIYYWSDADQEYFTPQSNGNGVGTIDQVLANGNQIPSDTPIEYPDNGGVKTSYQNGLVQFDDTTSSKSIWFNAVGIIRYITGFYNTKRTVVQFEDPTQVNFITIGNESGKMATQEWTNSAIDSAAVGLLDDRGNWNASDNLFPNIGGSGDGGAILRGDLWTISVAGTLGGTAVTTGDVVRALVDSPGQTAANWSVTENNIGYVPENSANKATTMTGNTTSNMVFLTAKAVYDWGVSTFTTASAVATQITAALVGYATETWVNARLSNIAESTTDGTVSSGTSNTVTMTLSIPANTFAAGQIVDLIGLIRATGTAGTRAVRLYINTSADLSGTPILIGAYTGVSNTALEITCQRFLRIKVANGTGAGTEVMNTGNAVASNYSFVASSVTTCAIDWTVAQHLVMTVQATNSGDSLRGTALKIRR